VLPPQGDPALDTTAADVVEPEHPSTEACGGAGAVAHGDTPVAPDEPVSAAPADASPRRLASLVEVLMCSGFPTQLLITASLVVAGLRPLEPGGELSLRFIAWLSLIDTVLLVGLVLLFLRARGERPADVLVGRRPRWRELGLGMALVPAAFGLVALAALAIQWVAPGLRDPDGNPLAALLKDKENIAVFAAIAVLAGGCREEIQRGFVLHRFDQHLGGPAVGLGLFSVAFGLGHVMQGWDAAILTALLGAFWGFVYLSRRSILAPAVCHATFNLIEVLYHGLSA
jgi:membrane protease YdiL (CAAX protease family)